MNSAFATERPANGPRTARKHFVNETLAAGGRIDQPNQIQRVIRLHQIPSARKQPYLRRPSIESLFQRGGLVHAVELGMQLAVDESAATLLESVQRCSLADAAVGPNMKHGAEQGANGKEYNLVVTKMFKSIKTNRGTRSQPS
ncbi:hypothetical protein JZU51_00975 [bacterium]|nr:hypothetical protein [bacterium]